GSLQLAPLCFAPPRAVPHLRLLEVHVFIGPRRAAPVPGDVLRVHVPPARGADRHGRESGRARGADPWGTRRPRRTATLTPVVPPPRSRSNPLRRMVRR